MNRYFFIFIILFLSSLLIYSVYLVNTKKKMSIKGILICVLGCLLFMAYAVLKPDPTVSDLREELKDYPQSVIAEYLQDEYDFSEIVDMYGEYSLLEYVYTRYSIDDLYDADDIAYHFSPFDIWDGDYLLSLFSRDYLYEYVVERGFG